MEDSKILLESICGYDKKDSQSVDRSDVLDWDNFENFDIKKCKILLPKQFLSD